jgi:hypothetical protein
MRTLGLAVCLVFAAGFTAFATRPGKPRFETGVVAAPEPGRMVRTGTWLTASRDDGDSWSALVLVAGEIRYARFNKTWLLRE